MNKTDNLLLEIPKNIRYLKSIRHLAKLFGSGALAPPKEDEAKVIFSSFARTLLTIIDYDN